MPSTGSAIALLTEPFGYGIGDSISLTCTGPVDGDRLTKVLLSYSCYPPAIPKIIACLTHSHRYDCVLQAAWFRQQHRQLRRDLAALGVELTITEACDWIPTRFR